MQLAIITETTRGLGKALSEQFDSAGWSVAEMSRPTFDLSELNHSRVSDYFADIARAGFDRTVLMHNAAEMHIGPASVGHADAERIIRTNLLSVIELTSLYLRHMPKGEVAAITSSAARAGVANWSLYCAAKAGVEGYFRALKAEGVVTHLFEPGIVDTDMQALLRDTSWPGAEQFVGYKNQGRLKSPGEVARRIFNGLSAVTP